MKTHKLILILVPLIAILIASLRLGMLRATHWLKRDVERADYIQSELEKRKQELILKSIKYGIPPWL